ncbi:hypothetical protein [Luteolibacter marinus]|uniref:hypothetical protein n=1 Tax=Luteolibacter marinus TaxID=2776705 RepID=UPI001866187F|nr:hypothetical protein [Luteolibacter marinus]
MKQQSSIRRAALPLGLGVLALTTAASPALEVVAASFGGCGLSGSANYTTLGTSAPSAARPVGCASSMLCPGPLFSAYRPSLSGLPKVHLVKSGPGVLTLMAVPDAPGWSWQQSTNLVSWTPMAEPLANPQLIPMDQPRRFFRLEQP